MTLLFCRDCFWSKIFFSAKNFGSEAGSLGSFLANASASQTRFLMREIAWSVSIAASVPSPNSLRLSSLSRRERMSCSSGAKPCMQLEAWRRMVVRRKFTERSPCRAE